MASQLTAAQLQTLKASIAANTAVVNGTPINELPNNSDANLAIANWYNGAASPEFVVWRDLPVETVLGLVTYANMTPLDAVPTVAALGSNPTAAQQATYDNQTASVATWQARSLACQGKQFNLQNLTLGRTTAPMKRVNYRAALQDCLTNVPAGASGASLAANWVGVRDAAKFPATNAEKLYAAGTGSSASPADLAFEGSITADDVQEARNLA